MRHSKIVASGSYAPDRVIKNEWFNEQLGEDVDTWLRENLTIRERRWMEEDQTTSDLCVQAGNSALKMANMGAEDIDLLIIATDTPDFISPSTASVVQHKMGLENATSLDTNTACAGFPTALTMANSMMSTDPTYQKVMVMGAYGMSRFLNLDDKKTVTLFADGAGAVILEPTDEEGVGFLASDLRTKPEYYKHMGIYGGGAAAPAARSERQGGAQCLQFVEKFPKEINPRIWTDMIRSLAEKAKFDTDEISGAYMTQININQIWETMDNLSLKRAIAPTIMDRFGYTGSAAIPMVFDSALRDGAVKDGDLLVFVGSGGGLHFGACAYRW
ncbi:3-oxoacyl-ACP synthase III family protein [Fodinibius halophilus]|uniref:Ketoacyl-ACP synthase III n=1 Tax=Fodinibius halophilus TaxID=1736908 RepID=A0A6M1T0A6_9BACT|nr:ketoacyl-ACP synthase III [Fodinibius halophilus]NGP89538.1 ketoacyl-ACP synthase III [Fodinibius halophilus]